MIVTETFATVAYSKIFQTTWPRHKATRLDNFERKDLLFQQLFTFNMEAANSFIKHYQERKIETFRDMTLASNIS